MSFVYTHLGASWSRKVPTVHIPTTAVRDTKGAHSTRFECVRRVMVQTQEGTPGLEKPSYAYILDSFYE